MARQRKVDLGPTSKNAQRDVPRQCPITGTRRCVTTECLVRPGSLLNIQQHSSCSHSSRTWTLATSAYGHASCRSRVTGDELPVAFFEDRKIRPLAHPNKVPTPKHAPMRTTTDTGCCV
jgi:hypothetical protein